MKKILLSVLTIALVATVAVGATRAYFSDTETSFDNTFTAGSLNLTVDGNDGTNTVKWTLSNLVPGSQPTGKFILANTGSVNGFLDLESIQVTSSENGIIEPESEAGDITTPDGELENTLNMRLYWDKNCDGYFSAGDEYIYNGFAANVGSSYDKNIPIPAGGNTCVTGVFDWWPNSAPFDGVTPYHVFNDNLAMTDSFDLDMTFELGQTTAQ